MPASGASFFTRLSAFAIRAARHGVLFTAVALVLTSAGARPGTGAAEAGPCNTRETILSLLAARYQETPIALGITSEGSLVEVLSNAAGKTWTIIITSPEGVSCLILSGDDWQLLDHTGAGTGTAGPKV